MVYDLIVVSSYPPQNQTHGNGTVGVASYAKNTLLSFPHRLNILVVAEILPGQSTDYHEGNVQVLRLWRRNSIISFLKIYQLLRQHPHSKIMFEFEMAMFGNPLLNLFFIKLLFLLRLSHRQVYVVLHQVVLNFQEISGHIGQSKGSLINHVLNFLARIFYNFVINFSHQVIVFEKFLKDRLDRDNPKIIVIPHGVEVADHIQNKLLKHHDKFIITVFGYLAWYKGTDWIVKTLSNYFRRHPRSKIKLVIAGGPNPNHLDKPYYQKYLKEINDYANLHPQHISVTGFVNEVEIAKIYQTSDLIVLPYRVGMSSSGPLSLAFTHSLPFLVSQKISPILDTPDIHEILNKKLVEFSLNPTSFIKKVVSLQQSPVKLKKLSKISGQIANNRQWSNISQLYLQCLGL